MKRELENARRDRASARSVRAREVLQTSSPQTLAAVPLAFAASPLKIYFARHQDRQLRRLDLHVNISFTLMHMNQRQISPQKGPIDARSKLSN